ncbi:geranylgeranylglyceryl/heptaprenylglyceryl phosphate synthase [Cecembia calidifontis]|jgi:putative glycerol-1-phosphate prenyltransferase|uniref:Geranylgeranylglyceryl phosphate synthase n=1 Tax=Cecembia calidifontis TaxID=1187080 RepID=A0A4Q7P6M6_9BACT|nr:geranylgeranylglyceryl/heptaprenylglyceryl phosphate synthase [Cecembia calidifontis]RZS95140.1 putative glycerol-1-phosphate prenyltransferase [Cecembia calidifontis]
MKNEVGDKIKSISLSGRKGIAWLIDPDDLDEITPERLELSAAQNIDFIFLGGSLIQKNNIGESIQMIRKYASGIPIVLFPGNSIQFSLGADAILFLSLISGRNPELLIGQHVNVAPLIAKSNLEVLATGYMLVDGGEKTSVHYISQTIPLPNHHPELSVATALAGFYLGLQYFYLDAGSGAPNPVNPKLIKAVKQSVPAPLIVGGGLNTLDKIKNAFLAGADLVVIGNGAVKSPNLLEEANTFLESLRVMAN